MKDSCGAIPARKGARYVLIHIMQTVLKKCGIFTRYAAFMAVQINLGLSRKWEKISRPRQYRKGLAADRESPEVQFLLSQQLPERVMAHYIDCKECERGDTCPVGFRIMGLAKELI